MYDMFVKCNWVDTRWQWHSTHLHTNNAQNNTMIQNTQSVTYITNGIHKHNDKNAQFTQLNRSRQNIEQKHIKHISLQTNLGIEARAPSLRVSSRYLPFRWGKSTEKPQYLIQNYFVRVSVIQIIFASKLLHQYPMICTTEQTNSAKQ
jgi:hypothetical protein